MSNTNSKNLSPFAQSALALDSDFTELTQLSGQLERLSIESEMGLERAKKILAQFGECGERIGGRLQELAKNMQEAQSAAGRAAELVTSRATQVQQRQMETNQMTQRFSLLNETVRKINTALLQLKKTGGEKISAEEKSLIDDKLPELHARMGTLIDEAVQLKQDARQAGMKTLEKNADSLGQTLNSARRKIGSLLGSPSSSSQELH